MKIAILTTFSNRIEGKNFCFCPYHPGKNGNSRPGGVPRRQERKFPPGWSRILARVVIFPSKCMLDFISFFVKTPLSYYKFVRIGFSPNGLG